jgi:CTP:phosphocholine cytidylyltransferase-like protein
MVNNKQPIEALIIATEVTKGMKSIGSKSLLKIKHSLVVIEHQIIKLQKTYKNIKITIATGFEADKMKKLLENYNINFLHNPRFESTNQAKSILDFIALNIPERLFILNNGVLFKEIPKVLKKSLEKKF